MRQGRESWRETAIYRIRGALYTRVTCPHCKQFSDFTFDPWYIDSTTEDIYAPNSDHWVCHSCKAGFDGSEIDAFLESLPMIYEPPSAE